ncbi:MAG: lipopolysaccharide transport system permease protein [Alphaproteobacteria bacterium]|nr:MAG: lipopolysaccharide transport system permease protein [Caulobacteraceae bacterium]TPW08937.1 MAG: lipopolysaccharide transport system permease protein [Alphaproteobacteria bacterium]
MSVQGIGLQTVRVGRVTLGSYLAGMWRYRHLMFHLANADLQSRFRRSSLGVVWAMIHPLSFAMLYSLVLANLFQQEFKTFSIYVFAGFILWDALSSFVHLGSQSIINGAGYLKQAPIPMLIFPLRTCITVTVVFLIGFLALLIYRTGVILMFGLDEPIMTIYWAWAAPLVIALFVMGSAWATIVAFINLKFRDTQQLLMILMQAVWFSSPVFFDRSVFDNPRLELWSAINPVLAFCDAFRDPVIYGRPPEMRDWIAIGVWTGLSWLVAIVITAINDRKSIHYV